MKKIKLCGLLFIILALITNSIGAKWPMRDNLGANFVFKVNSNFCDHRPTGTWHFHHGIDIQAVTGGEVCPVKAGTVRYAQGTSVVMEHDDGIYSYYTHLKSFTVQPGQVLSESGYIGDGADMHSNHLHFSLMNNFRGGSYITQTNYDWHNPLREDYYYWTPPENPDMVDLPAVVETIDARPKLNTFYVEQGISNSIEQWNYLESSTYPFTNFQDNIWQVSLSSHTATSESKDARFLVKAYSSFDDLKLYLQADDDFWGGSNNGTPEKIQVYIDEKKFYDINFVSFTGENLYNQRSIYCEEPPLNSRDLGGGNYIQYYRLFKIPNINNYPNVNKIYSPSDKNYPLDFNNLDEGQHTIIIHLKDLMCYNDENDFTKKTIRFYILKNKDEYVDFCYSN